ncbi:MULTISPECIES: hypothetical protein [unclassified Serratia (in: enterobacteria)]|uniref:hypothetical protein n=1 Tax=unclassified Serratia (in: enterobacteria) TaxID=2647522 RepID=UPI003075FA29
MSEKALNELRNNLSRQEEVIEHLLVRSEISLQVLSAVLHKRDIHLDALKLQIEQFKCNSSHVRPDILEIEKRRLIKVL